MTELEINSTQELNEKLNELTKDASLNKPSEEEIEQARKEFEQASKEWSVKMYPIGTIEDTVETCEYIKHFLRNRFLWQKDAWMGVIKLTEELDAALTLFNSQKNKPVEVGYHALEFMYYILSNPAGYGLESAKDFESEHDIYTKTAIAIGKELESARKKLKDIEFLQQKWGAMAQGFYLEVEPENESEDNGPTEAENEGQEPDEPNVETFESFSE